MSGSVPPPVGPNLQQWARSTRDWLQRRADKMRWKTDEDTPSENGILLRPGDKIELEGFESPDHMELNWITNITTGESIQLRTAEGMPVWNQ